MNRQGLTYTILFTFVVSFIFVFFLALANEGTAEQVALNQTVNRQRAVLNALGIQYSGPDEVLLRYQDVEEIDREGVSLYRAQVEGEIVYAKEFSGSGLWGTITGILAVDEQLGRTVGLEIISHNETPGLGGRIDEAWFKDQFRGERLVDGSVEVAGGGDGDDDYGNGRVDAITGASRTSDSMQVILDDELGVLSQVLGGNS